MACIQLAGQVVTDDSPTDQNTTIILGGGSATLERCVCHGVSTAIFSMVVQQFSVALLEFSVALLEFSVALLEFSVALLEFSVALLDFNVALLPGV